MAAAEQPRQLRAPGVAPGEVETGTKPGNGHPQSPPRAEGTQLVFTSEVKGQPDSARRRKESWRLSLTKVWGGRKNSPRNSHRGAHAPLSPLARFLDRKQKRSFFSARASFARSAMPGQIEAFTHASFPCFPPSRYRKADSAHAPNFHLLGRNAVPKEGRMLVLIEVTNKSAHAPVSGFCFTPSVLDRILNEFLQLLMY